MEKPVTIHAPGHPPPFREPSPLHRAVGASALGNAVEWFDYGIYAYGVTYISAALFPGDTEEAVLFALATFAISFLFRPLGELGRASCRERGCQYWLILVVAGTLKKKK